MKTSFTAEEWGEFCEDCDMYAWRAEDLALACKKALSMIEDVLKAKPATMLLNYCLH
jgi:hypothetical protein